MFIPHGASHWIADHPDSIIGITTASIALKAAIIFLASGAEHKDWRSRTAGHFLKGEFVTSSYLRL